MPDVETITLWHYCSLDGDKLGYAIETLRDNTVFLASPEAFNDLHDCRFTINRDAPEKAKLATYARVLEREEGITPEEASKKARELLDDPAELRVREERNTAPERVGQYRKGYGVYCMSESRDDPVLWGQYAAKHAGLCIGFSAKVSRARRAGFMAGVPGVPPVLQVQYEDSDALPVLNLYNEDPLDILPTVTTKSKAWCHEREWRFALAEAANKKLILPSGAITDVILGAKITPDNRKAIARAVQEHQPQARLFEARQRDGRRGLGIVPISPVG